MKKNIYITTSIPYVNAEPHIGHALELVQTDVIARFSRLLGYKTIFQTGTDENALKNVLAAKEQGLTTKELVDRNSKSFRDLIELLDISADTFIRTTEARHKKGVWTLWNRLSPKDLYKKSYRGLYCTGCENFYLERDLVDGKCPEHRIIPARVKEENYFFRLSSYTEILQRLIESDKIKVIPAKRRNEVLGFIERGLQDISISRDTRRSGGWGIAVPNDDSQIIYVWIDALINYISGRGFGEGEPWNSVWREGVNKIHMIGKDIWKFHAVYWPALLLSADLPLPNEIVIHGFLTVDGQKMSKSIGNVVNPVDCVNKYGSDAFRYYLLRAVPPFDDGDYSEEQIERLYNSNLANGLGNLSSRIAALWEKSGMVSYSLPEQPKPEEHIVDGLKRYEFDKVLQYLWQQISNVNRDINDKRPWEHLQRSDPEGIAGDLRLWINALHEIGFWLKPFLPRTSDKIVHCLQQKQVSKLKNLFPRTRR